jgi:hypothetical protein
LHLTVFFTLPFDIGFVIIIACWSHKSPYFFAFGDFPAKAQRREVREKITTVKKTAYYLPLAPWRLCGKYSDYFFTFFAPFAVNFPVLNLLRLTPSL